MSCCVVIKLQILAPVHAVSFHITVSRWHGANDTATQSHLQWRNTLEFTVQCLIILSLAALSKRNTFNNMKQKSQLLANRLGISLSFYRSAEAKKVSHLFAYPCELITVNQKKYHKIMAKNSKLNCHFFPLSWKKTDIHLFA